MNKTPPTSSDVRQWARSKGMEVGERGRLSPELVAAYAAAHGGPPVTAPAKKAAKKTAKKAARKPAARKTAAKKAPVKRATVTRAPMAQSAPRALPVVSEPRVPSFRAAEVVTEAPTRPADDGRVAALETQIARLSARLERLEAAGAQKRGFFSRK